MPEVAQSPLRIVVSRDNLRVELNLKGIKIDSITPKRIAERLLELGVALSEETTASFEEIPKKALEATRSGENMIVILEGRPPVPGKPASFKPIDPGDREQGDQETQADAAFDNRKCRIQIVKAGEPIGEYVPAVEPIPGLNVYGKPITGLDCILGFELGQNVKLGDDGKTVVAAADGRIHITRQSVSVIEQVKIDGDVGLSTGNLETPTDVLVGGNVCESFVVRSPKSVTVKGTVEAATVEAGTDVVIAGGVTGRNKALIRAAGELQVKFIEDADVETGGDVVVTKEVMNCRLHTRGKLLVPRGPIVGGSVYVREAIECLILGNDAYLPTEIAIGILPSALAQVTELAQSIKKKKEAAAKIRQTVAPLLAQLKRLNPQQREKATELMFEADRIEEEADELEAKRLETIGPYMPPAGQEAFVLVNKMVYPGTSFIFGDKIATISKMRRGPIKFVSRAVDRVESIMIVDPLSGSTQILPSQPYAPPAANEQASESTGAGTQDLDEAGNLGSTEASTPAATPR